MNKTFGEYLKTVFLTEEEAVNHFKALCPDVEPEIDFYTTTPEELVKQFFSRCCNERLFTSSVVVFGERLDLVFSSAANAFFRQLGALGYYFSEVATGVDETEDVRITDTSTGSGSATSAMVNEKTEASSTSSGSNTRTEHRSRENFSPDAILTILDTSEKMFEKFLLTLSPLWLKVWAM